MGVSLIQFEQDDGYWKHCDGHEYRRDRRRQYGARAIDGLQDRQRDESGISHRGCHAMHGSAGETAGSTNAHNAEDEKKAEERPTAKGNKKAPIDQRTAWFLCNGAISNAGIAML